ncbi:MAG: PAS domain S-box protein [Breznakibacter sp.]
MKICCYGTHRLRNRTYQQMFDSGLQALLILHNEKIVDCSPGALNILQTPSCFLKGKSLDDLSPKFQPDGTLSHTLLKNIMQAKIPKQTVCLFWSFETSNRQLIHVYLQLFPLKKKKGHIAVVLIPALQLQKAIIAAPPRMQLNFFRENSYSGHASPKEFPFKSSDAEGKPFNFPHYLHLALECWPDDIWMTDRQGRFWYQNPASQKQWGNFIGQTPSTIHANGHIKKKIGTIFAKVLSGQKMNIESVANVDNAPAFFHWSFQPIQTVEGIVGILGISVNITQWKRKGKSATTNAKKFSTIYNASKDGIAILNKKFDIIDLNPSILIKSGYTKNELLGRNVIEMLSDYGNHHAKQRIESLISTGTATNFETEIMLKNNIPLPIEISATAIEIDKHPFWLMTVRDISDRKKLESELLNCAIHAEEKERLLFSQELHDGLSPLIAAAKLHAELIAQSDGNTSIKAMAQDVIKLLNEATQTLRDISFKLSPYILQQYGLEEALKAYASYIEKALPIRISIHNSSRTRLNETAETIVYRILCECIHNTIKYGNASHISINLHPQSGSMVIIYKDNGKGFDVEKIIADKKGMGILNMQSRIKSLKGLILFESKLGQGVTFTIKLPLNNYLKPG